MTTSYYCRPGILPDTVRLLHIPCNLRGFRYLVRALEETVFIPSRTLSITKELYPAVARIYRVSPSSVERSIRTAIAACWNSDEGRKALDEMCGYHLTQRPTASHLIALMTDYILRTHF